MSSSRLETSYLDHCHGEAQDNSSNCNYQMLTNTEEPAKYQTIPPDACSPSPTISMSVRSQSSKLFVSQDNSRRKLYDNGQSSNKLLKRSDMNRGDVNRISIEQHRSPVEHEGIEISFLHQDQRPLSENNQPTVVASVENSSVILENNVSSSSPKYPHIMLSSIDKSADKVQAHNDEDNSSVHVPHALPIKYDRPTRQRHFPDKQTNHADVLGNLYDSEEEDALNHLDEFGNAIEKGDDTNLNNFSINDFFEKYRNITLLNDDEPNIMERNESGSVKNGDLGFKELDDVPIKPKKNNLRAINRLAKMRGESYKRSDGTIVPARCIKPACSCVRLKCYEKFTCDTRSKILASLLQLSSSGQNQVISSNMGLKVTTRPTVLNSRRTYTRSYHLPALNGRVQVCKPMFMATFDVKDKKLRVLAAKQLAGIGIASDDMRLNNRNPRMITEDHRRYVLEHIQSFPAYSSHYTRESTSKKYLSSDLNIVKMYKLYKVKCANDGLDPVHLTTYRILFRTQNLSFRKPKADTCNTCDKLSTRLKVAKSETEKSEIIEERDRHQHFAQSVYDAKRMDVQAAKSSESIRTVSFDLQKCLPTPHLQCGTAFYCRQLYTLNFTMFSSEKSGNSVTCYMWDESKARRGSQEMSSCIFDDLKKMRHAVREVNYYSDRCAGQNHNFILCMMFSFFMYRCSAENRSMTVRHKFMTSGHSHMEVDSVHACIEKAKKRSTINIETPRDWVVFVSSIERKVPFVVHDMEQREFLAFKALEDNFKKPKCNVHGEPIRFKEVSWFEYRSDNPGIVYYKYTLQDKEFMQFDIRLHGTEQPYYLPQNLPPISNDPLPLSNEKLADLRKLMDFVINKPYYAALLGQLAPKKRGRKSKKDMDDHFEDDLDIDIDDLETGTN